MRRTLLAILASALVAVSAAGCGSTATSGTPTAASGKPIVIGISLASTGPKADDSKNMALGYQYWAKAVNANGGLLGRPVQLDIAHDDGTADQITAAYEKLITTDHVDLLLGPFSSSSTLPAAQVAQKHNYALIEGAGTSPVIFQQGFKVVFSVSLSAADYLTGYVQWLLNLPAAQRPSSVAYETDDDIFSQPTVLAAKKALEAAGMKTVFSGTYTSGSPVPAADISSIATSGAQVFIQGTTSGLVDMTPFLAAFKAHHYTPQSWIATSGPDDTQGFVKGFGIGDSEAVMVPNSPWYPAVSTTGNQAFVSGYVAAYGGSGADISADAVEAYSAGQVLQDVVASAGSIDNQAILTTLRSGATWQTLQGPVRFSPDGQNAAGVAALFQWQQGALVVVYPASLAQAKPEFPKPPLS